MLPFFRKLIFNTWFLAAVPAIIAFFFLHSSSFRYRLTVEDAGLPGYQDVYYDLNGDSLSEILRTGKGIPLYNILVMDNNHKVYDQWNLKDYIDYDMSRVFFGDYDNDKFREIYIFTYRNDSLFLNVNEFFQPSGTLIDGAYITNISSIDGKVTSSVSPAGFYDTDDDNVNELYFTICTGFGLVPRKAYIYNFVKHTLSSSELTGVIPQFPKLEDIDEDGRAEIFGNVSASGNYNIPVPYTDYSSWLMVFGSDLSFKFPPVEFPGFTNYLQTDFIKKDGFRAFILLNATGSTSPEVKSGIMTYTPDGRLMRYRSLRELGYPDGRVRMRVIDDRIFLSGSKVIEVDTNLKILREVQSPLKSQAECYAEDVNHDGHNELLIYSFSEKRLAIFNTSLKELSEASVDFKNYFVTFSHYDSANEHKLFISSPEVMYMLGFSRNQYYYLGQLAYPGIYLFFVLFILLVKKIHTIQIVEKEEMKQRLLTLQLKAIKSQLDPHFTFNTLNSVASLIYGYECHEAYNYLTKFTSLLRNMVNDAEKIYRTLDEEIKFVRTYLELEKMRFGDKFNYFIETGSEVEGNEEIPKLVLFTFAENAIKHGLMPKEDEGILRIKIDRNDNKMNIFIEDNGIGRERSEGKSTSTGKGLKLTSEFYDILNRMNHGRIQYSINDLHDASGKASGTAVGIQIELFSGKTHDRNILSPGSRNS